MFGAISGRYDLLNHLLSANRDRAWRRAVARQVAACRPARVLDLCGGTGDLSAELAVSGAAGLVVCCDFSHPMLRLAHDKFASKGLTPRCITIEADALRLPFASGVFDVVSIGFGLRNLADMDRGLREMHRVLRPGGQLVVLEFSTPPNRLLAWAYGLYLRGVLPRLGEAYGYLAGSIAEFPDATRLAGVIRGSGFETCAFGLLFGGIVAIHTGHKAA
jgi:demethylmenaquinone methyltransferase/2-methoxy-6-polyprenyl-1,4-benzoquinol methylase